MPAGYEDNLLQAKQAYDYTKGKLTIGASNKWSDMITSLGAAQMCVRTIRRMGTDVPLPAHAGKVPTHLRAAAYKAEAAGCGNCGEHAAVAFMYLYNKSQFPVEVMQGSNVDHLFVVLGRDAAGDVDKPGKWGEKAVICDPWNGNYFPATEFKEKMHKGWEMVPTTFVRAESQGDVKDTSGKT